jgi:hypothetical protein
VMPVRNRLSMSIRVVLGCSPLKLKISSFMYTDTHDSETRKEDANIQPSSQSE